MELSGPEGKWSLGLVLALSVIAFWPLALLAVLDVGGTARKLLIAAGPVSICMGFAALVLLCGYRYGKSLGWTRTQTWGLVAMFLGLGLLGGLGLWFSEG